MCHPCHICCCRRTSSKLGPLVLRIPGTNEAENAAIINRDDLLFLSFPDYLATFTSPAFQVSLVVFAHSDPCCTCC